MLACALPGPASEAPAGFTSILANQDAQHRRDRQIVVINAQGLSDPEHLKKPSASCWIKMSTVSVEALRQAFRDPESRVRLVSNPQPTAHTEFVAIAWEAGFLGGAAIHFNENLNVLVRCANPSPVTYTIERTIPNSPTVRDEHGNLMNIAPKDLIPTVEVFVQHEISDLTRGSSRSRRSMVKSSSGCAGRSRNCAPCASAATS